jgi:sulfur-oxidizing protein SoxB
LLPGQDITREWLMDMTATTYSFATVTEMSGEMIKTVLEDVGDNLFNPDPYYQQGGDMVRVGGLTYACDPMAPMGRRISDMRLGGELIDASKRYKVAGWAPVAEEARRAGHKQVWEIVEQWLKAQGGRVRTRALNTPRLIGALPNPGHAG